MKGVCGTILNNRECSLGVRRGKHQAPQGHCICHNASVEEERAGTPAPRWVGRAPLGVPERPVSKKTLKGPLTCTKGLWSRKILKNPSHEFILSSIKGSNN